MKKRIKLFILSAVSAAAGLAVIYLFYFYKPGHGIGCFTYKYLGIYCMGCGSTRQLYYALHGQFEKAFFYNVACIIIYPIYAYMYYLLLSWSVFDKNIGAGQAYVLAGAAVILVIYMIMRNIPVQAFDFLRPPT